MKEIRILTVLLAVLLTSGCSFKEAAPMKIYTLDAGKVAPVASSKYRSSVLKVSYPQTLKERMSDKMCFSYSSSDRGVYLNSEWSNAVEKLVQGSVIEVLQQSRLFKAVLPYASTAGEDYRLESMIYDFSHHVRGNASYAVVSIQFSLIDTYTGKLIKSRRFSYKEPTQTVDASGYVYATNKAMHRLAHDLMLWLK